MAKPNESDAPVLRITTETLLTVDVYDLEGYIRHHTGQDGYEIIQGEEWHNDSQHRVEVGDGMSEYEVSDYKEFCSGEHDGQYRLRTIMNGLYQEGKLEAGTYLIEVCWLWPLASQSTAASTATATRPALAPQTNRRSMSTSETRW